MLFKCELERLKCSCVLTLTEKGSSQPVYIVTAILFHEVMDECHVPMLSCLLVSRRDCPSITIICNEAHYLPASKHLTLAICSELQSDWKNQDLFALQNDCQVHFHLWKPFGNGKDGDWDGKKMMSITISHASWLMLFLTCFEIFTACRWNNFFYSWLAVSFVINSGAIFTWVDNVFSHSGKIFFNKNINCTQYKDISHWQSSCPANQWCIQRGR